MRPHKGVLTCPSPSSTQPTSTSTPRSRPWAATRQRRARRCGRRRCEAWDPAGRGGVSPQGRLRAARRATCTTGLSGASVRSGRSSTASAAWPTRASAPSSSTATTTRSPKAGRPSPSSPLWSPPSRAHRVASERFTVGGEEVVVHGTSYAVSATSENLARRYPVAADGRSTSGCSTPTSAAPGPARGLQPLLRGRPAPLRVPVLGARPRPRRQTPARRQPVDRLPRQHPGPQPPAHPSAAPKGAVHRHRHRRRRRRAESSSRSTGSASPT